MHQALQLAEIFEVVCSFANRSTLACLARTCRSFEDTSLDTLWRELHDSAEISLGQLAVVTGDVPLDDNTMAYQCPTYNHWERMRKYTSRVVVVKFSGELDFEFDTAPLRSLHWVLSSPAPLRMFPKLKKIWATYLPTHILNLPLLRFVNGPSVTNVRWTIDSYRWGWMDDTAASLSSLYPNARTVSLITCGKLQTPAGIIHNLSRGICSWQNLAHGSFSILDARAYEHLCRLKTLTSLHIDLSSHGNYARFQEAQLPLIPFPALTSIHLHISTIDDLAQWLSRHNKFPLVSTFIFHIRIDSWSVLGPQDLCNLIASHFCCQSLRRMCIYYPYSPPPIIRLNDIRPLLSFNNLRAAFLSGFCIPSIDDDALQVLASSWPFIEELALRHFLPINTHCIDIPTFKGLFKLVEHCPRLRNLSILIDTRDSAWVDLQKPCGSTCPFVVSELILANSPIVEAERVALILKAIFPSLEQLNLEMFVHEELSPLWYEVNALLANLCAAGKTRA